MIPVNELRVGVWVKRNFRYGSEFAKITPYDIWHYREAFRDRPEHQVEINALSPIPLTPEILQKSGFEIDEDNYAVRGHYRIYCKDGDTFHLEGIQVPHQFKYLHQLQNLYFALSGEELPITL